MTIADQHGDRGVLVVSTVKHAEGVVSDLVANAGRVKVVVPVVGEGIIDWLANDEKAFSRAQDEARRLGERIPGETVDTSAGDSNVSLAVQDALAEFPADEVVIIASSQDESAISDALARIQNLLDGMPVRVVTVDEVP